MAKTLDLVATPKTFKDKETGKDIPYFEYSVNISGVEIQMFTKKDDFTAKKLLKSHFTN